MHNEHFFREFRYSRSGLEAREKFLVAYRNARSVEFGNLEKHSQPGHVRGRIAEVLQCTEKIPR